MSLNTVCCYKPGPLDHSDTGNIHLVYLIFLSIFEDFFNSVSKFHSSSCLSGNVYK